jgi:hypothetical protein
MAIPTPGQLYADLDKEGKASFDRQLAKYNDDPDTYDNPWESIEDYAYPYDEVRTPDKVVEAGTKARLTISSTSTTNPEEPRTLAAGYDERNFILTVQFRDGTLYNYYDVPPEMWSDFKRVVSKGEFLRTSGLDTWPDDRRGVASGSNTAWFKSRAVRAAKQQKENYGIQHGKRL